MVDIAALGFEVDSSQARGAAKALSDLNSAAIKAANGAAKFERTLRDTSGRFQSTNKYLSEHHREVEALARAYNPAMAAQIAYRDEVIKTATAVKAGVITEQQRIDILNRTKDALENSTQSYSRFSSGVSKGGRAVNHAGLQFQNASYQVGDFFVQIASGTDATRALAQQLPQLLGGFGVAGAALGALAAIGGALAPALLGAARNANTFRDAVDGVTESSDELRKSAGALAGSDLEQLRAKYGELTEQTWSLVRAQGALAELELSNKMKDLRQEIEQFSSGRWYDFGISDAASGVLKLQTELKISRNDAIALYDRLSDIGSARGPIETAEKLANARDYALQLADGNEQAASAIEPLARRLVDAEDAARQAAAATNEWSGNMASVLSFTNAVARTLSSIGQTGIQIAGAQAELTALRQGKTLREAGFIAARKTLEVEGKQRTEELVKQHGIIGATMATLEIGQKAALINVQQQLAVEQDIAREREREAAKTGGVGAASKRAAAQLRQAEKGFQSFRELIEKESLFQFAEYDKRQKQLENALNKRLLTQETYETYAQQLRTLYFGAEFEQRALQYQLDNEQLRAALDQRLITEQEYFQRRKEMQWAQLLNEDNRTAMSQDLANTAAYFGQLNSISGSGFDGLLRAQKAFAAASALINTWKGYTDALAQGGLSPWAKLAWGAKILAAGFGAVSAIKGGGSGSGSGTSGAASATTTTPARQEPVRQVLVRLEGDDWLVGMADNIMTQIYDQTKDGRVVVARDR